MSLLFADEWRMQTGALAPEGVRFQHDRQEAPCFSRARMADRLLAKQQGEME